jgi:hypothetical protein
MRMQAFQLTFECLSTVLANEDSDPLTGSSGQDLHIGLKFG